MQLIEINVEMFRNHVKTKLKPHNFLNIITGKNAQGKTNLLEAIFFNLTGYSYRTSNYKDLINWNSSITSVSTVILKDDIEHKQCVAINKDGEKKIKINEIEKKTGIYIIEW